MSVDAEFREAMERYGYEVIPELEKEIAALEKRKQAAARKRLEEERKLNGGKLVKRRINGGELVKYKLNIPDRHGCVVPPSDAIDWNNNNWRCHCGKVWKKRSVNGQKRIALGRMYMLVPLRVQVARSFLLLFLAIYPATLLLHPFVFVMLLFPSIFFWPFVISENMRANRPRGYWYE